MQRSIAALALALATGCASDVDLQLNLDGQGSGEPSSSIGTLRSTHVLPGPGVNFMNGLAWHPAGLFIAGGAFEGTTDLGAGPISSEVSTGFVAAYDSTTGEPAWSRVFTGFSATAASYQLTGAAVDDVVIATDGTVLAAGSFNRAIDFGTGPIDSTDGCSDGVVARYGYDGTPLAPFILPRSPLYAAAAMPDGGLVASGAEIVGDCPVTEGGSQAYQPFLARFDAEGDVMWKLMMEPDSFVETIATTAAGDIVVLGPLYESVTVGGLSIAGPGFSSSGLDSFVARLSPDGVATWLASCERTTPEGACNARGIAVTSEGRVMVAAGFSRPVSLAGTVIESQTDNASTYIAELGDGAAPTLLAVVGDVNGSAAAVRDDPFDLLLAGSGSPSEIGEHYGPFVGVLAGATTLVGARNTDGAEPSWGVATNLAVGPAGEFAVAGQFTGQADFGGGPLSADADGDGTDGFVAIYERDVVESRTGR